MNEAVAPGRPGSGASLAALAALNFFLADARDGLGPFLDGFLATNGWSPFALGIIATAGGILGMAATPLFGALVDGSIYKRTLILVPVVLVTAAALLTLGLPSVAVVVGGQTVTALAGAVIGPALIGLTLGLVGEAAFPGQVSRNEAWNHAGNVVSLAGVYLAAVLFGLPGIVGLMILTALGTVVATLAIDPRRIDHAVARGLAVDADEPGPSGYDVLVRTPGLVLLGVILMVFHFGNAPMSRLIAQQYSIELGTPFRTTAIITGVAQLTMIASALLAPQLIRRFGLAAAFLVALTALPIRGAIAGSVPGFWAIYPVQFLDGLGAGLLGIVTPIAAERILSGTGRFNVGLAAVMTLQGIGASTSNLLAGWLAERGGYGLAHWVHGGVAVIALALFLGWRHKVVGDEPAVAERAPAPA